MEQLWAPPAVGLLPALGGPKASATTATGTVLSPPCPPVPSCPLALLPQQNRARSMAVEPHLCLPPASTNAKVRPPETRTDRKSTRLNSSHSQISYAVFCLKKKK